MTTPSFCSECGQAYAEQDKFCTRCGQARRSQVEPGRLVITGFQFHPSYSAEVRMHFVAIELGMCVTDVATPNPQLLTRRVKLVSLLVARSNPQTWIEFAGLNKDARFLHAGFIFDPHNQSCKALMGAWFQKESMLVKMKGLDVYCRGIGSQKVAALLSSFYLVFDLSGCLTTTTHCDLALQDVGGLSLIEVNPIE